MKNLISKFFFSKPVFAVNSSICRENIRLMAQKAKKSGVFFRPHFKTHQSLKTAEFFKEFSVTSITVSSVDMAVFFAQAGFSDILIAFPLNILQLPEICILSEKIHLELLVESDIHVTELKKSGLHNSLWIKIDTGLHRTGIPWDNTLLIRKLAAQIKNSGFSLKGLLTHAGHAYQANTAEGFRSVWEDSVSKLHFCRNLLLQEFPDLKLSAGDTPCCSKVSDLSGVDEIRPGNFVYYDLMQYALGSCSHDQIAASVICPVVSVHPQRQELVIYGGAVHFSKESVFFENQQTYGIAEDFTGLKRGKPYQNSFVRSLSQEHGVVKIPGNIVSQYRPGDLISIVPVHSCLTADLLRERTVFLS